MAEKFGMEGAADQVVDTHLVARDWWQENDGRLLPGEAGGITVYAVEFWDGCRLFDYTQGSAFQRVSELGFGAVEVWRNRFVAEHMGQMAYVVRCVTSDLTVADAAEVVNRLVVVAPVGMLPLGGGALEHPECFLGENALEPVTMSFGEWVKTREAAETGGSLSSTIP